MNPKIYVETSVISYLTARMSGDLVVAARQKVTQDWWDSAQKRFELFVSALVIDEISAGDTGAANARLNLVKNIPLLSAKEDIDRLVQTFIEKGPIPAKATEDAVHIAYATVHGMDYLVTWNFKHIANAEIRRAIAAITEKAGYFCPVICTPEELMGS